MGTIGVVPAAVILVGGFTLSFVLTDVDLLFMGLWVVWGGIRVFLAGVLLVMMHYLTVGLLQRAA